MLHIDSMWLIVKANNRCVRFIAGKLLTIVREYEQLKPFKREQDSLQNSV